MPPGMDRLGLRSAVAVPHALRLCNASLKESRVSILIVGIKPTIIHAPVLQTRHMDVVDLVPAAALQAYALWEVAAGLASWNGSFLHPSLGPRQAQAVAHPIDPRLLGAG